jgi:hypothetical protein
VRENILTNVGGDTDLCCQARCVGVPCVSFHSHQARVSQVREICLRWLHLSAFQGHPGYMLPDLPASPVSTLLVSVERHFYHEGSSLIYPYLLDPNILTVNESSRMICKRIRQPTVLRNVFRVTAPRKRPLPMLLASSRASAPCSSLSQRPQVVQVQLALLVVTRAMPPLQVRLLALASVCLHIHLGVND